VLFALSFYTRTLCFVSSLIRGEDTRKLRKKGFSGDTRDRFKSSNKSLSGGRKKESLKGEINDRNNIIDPTIVCIKVDLFR